jgi:hypothetical protein
MHITDTMITTVLAALGAADVPGWHAADSLGANDGRSRATHAIASTHARLTLQLADRGMALPAAGDAAWHQIQTARDLGQLVARTLGGGPRC